MCRPERHGLRCRDPAVATNKLIARNGRFCAKSEQALNDLETRFANLAAYQVAEIHAWRGEKGKAYEWLERAYRQHDAGLIYLKTDSLLDGLRGDEEFKAVLRKMKLPE